MPCAAMRPSQSIWLAGDAEHVIVEQRVAGAGIAGDQGVVAVDIGDVGDAADINHDDRPLPLQRLRQRAVIDRHERRALPAGGDVGGAEIVHHRNMDGFRQRGSVADLHRQLPFGAVQHGLAVKADDIDILAGDAVLRGEGGDGFRMRDGDGAFPPRAGCPAARRARRGRPLRSGPGAAGPALFRYKAGIRTARRPARACHRFRSMATSTPSSEVPLIRPIVVNIIAIAPSRPCLSSSSLCQTSTSYNATTRPVAAAHSAMVP